MIEIEEKGTCDFSKYVILKSRTDLEQSVTTLRDLHV